MVSLGQKVRDQISGFEGIATARCEYLNGCIQIRISPSGLDKDSKPQEPQWIDEGQIEGVKVDKSKRRGGPDRDHPREIQPPL